MRQIGNFFRAVANLFVIPRLDRGIHELWMPRLKGLLKNPGVVSAVPG